MTDQTKLERYVEIKQQIDKLEEELDGIKDEIFTFVDESGGTIDHDKFVVKSQKRAKYKFTDEYDAKNKDLKALRKDEIASGAATIESYSEYVTVKEKA